ncbi:MAG: rhodanese-like domain-containing protein [Actinomycetota bacterium]|jgi:rhodanese-related sulfurtransferase|nr:rhodanese-like domain-containing protein [Rubrobacter sp.]MDQ3237821.1 rhodanese-like domain-containing protein [Actinomycetota bacterium]MDQ3566855.1 rhodanese-like domain-containing protein [Actinomycetota bacterium]
MKTITREELKARMDGEDTFILLEVLSEESYRRGHLPGAVHYEGRDQVEGLAPDRNTEIIAYCSNFN